MEDSWPARARFQVVAQEEGEITLAEGDLVRVEYDSDAGVVTYLKNGDTLPHPPTQVKAGETFMFGLGRTAGVFEARIEGSSFVGSVSPFLR